MLPIYYSTDKFAALVKCISTHRAWKASLEVFSRTPYLKSESMYIPTPPAERGVGTYSKLYPVMFGLKSIKFEFVILVSATPMILKWKLSSFNKWVLYL